MKSKHLKWALILFVLYVLYKRFISKKEDFAVSPSIGPNGTVTEIKNLVPGVFYQRGTLKSGISNTLTGALNGGSTCTEFPLIIYIPVTPIDAVCNLGTNNINAYTPITETLEACPLVNGIPTKTLNKITDVATFNKSTTTTQAQYGGRDCFTQRQASLPSTSTFNCTSTIPSACDLTTIDKVYNRSAVSDSFSTCNVNVNGVWNKTIPKWVNASDIDSKATIIPGINGGASCSSQASSLPATTNVPCGSVNATCQGIPPDPTGIQSNTNSNYDTTTGIGGGTIIDTSSFWSTCLPSGASLSSPSDGIKCCTKNTKNTTMGLISPTNPTGISAVCA